MIKKIIILYLSFFKLCAAESSNYTLTVNSGSVIPQTLTKIIEKQTLVAEDCQTDFLKTDKKYKSIIEYILRNHVIYLFQDGRTVRTKENSQIIKQESDLLLSEEQGISWCEKYKDRLEIFYREK